MPKGFLLENEYKYNFKYMEGHKFNGYEDVTFLFYMIKRITEYIQREGEGLVSVTGTPIKHRIEAKIEDLKVMLYVNGFSLCIAELHNGSPSYRDKVYICEDSYMDKNKRVVIEMFLLWTDEKEEQYEPIGSIVYDDYNDYINSSRWDSKRKKKLHEANYKCQLCSKENTELHVHHNNYDNIANEEMNDLIVLCKECHQKHHDIED